MVSFFCKCNQIIKVKKIEAYKADYGINISKPFG